MFNNLAKENNYEDLDVGLLDDLKSDTMVGDADSIKKIIQEEKQLDEEKAELDKSFYTSSFGFTQRDFEELKNMNQTIKKSNNFMIILLVIFIGIIIAGIAIFILNK